MRFLLLLLACVLAGCRIQAGDAYEHREFGFPAVVAAVGTTEEVVAQINGNRAELAGMPYSQVADNPRLEPPLITATPGARAVAINKFEETRFGRYVILDETKFLTLYRPSSR